MGCPHVTTVAEVAVHPSAQSNLSLPKFCSQGCCLCQDLSVSFAYYGVSTDLPWFEPHLVDDWDVDSHAAPCNDMLP
jgi:hypothetical protein